MYDDRRGRAGRMRQWVCYLQWAGLAAGLTYDGYVTYIVCFLFHFTIMLILKGLLSLDITKLEIKSITGTDREKSAAVCVLPIIKQHHLLLVTLLLFNSLANETLPIFLGALVRIISKNLES